MMSANSSMKEQSPRSIQWRFAAPAGSSNCARGSCTITFLRTGATEKDRCLAQRAGGEAICPTSLPLKHGDWPWWFKWVMPEEIRRNPTLGVQTIQHLRWCGCVPRNVSGGSPVKVCSTSLAWGASDLARGGTEGVTLLGLRPKMAHRE